jgi:flagellar export protein FliJ
MSFKFPLAAVLRYRESIEQREYFALERTQQEIVRTEALIRQTEQDCSEAEEARVAELAKGTRAAHVKTAYDYRTALERQLEFQQALLQELKVKWRLQLASYDQARQNRETLEKLREKQLDTFRREQAKREQAAMDDIFLSRRGRSH